MPRASTPAGAAEGSRLAGEADVEPVGGQTHAPLPAAAAESGRGRPSAPTRTSPSAISSSAATRASGPCSPVMDCAFTCASEPAASSRRRPGGAVQERVGAALGVGDQHAEAAVAKLVGGGVKVVVDRLEGRLHQQPAPRGGPCAIDSSSSCDSRPTMSCPSSPPARSSIAMPSAAAASPSSRTRSGRSDTSVTKSVRTCGVATTVAVPSRGKAQQLHTLGERPGPSSSPWKGVEVELVAGVHLQLRFGARAGTFRQPFGDPGVQMV